MSKSIYAKLRQATETVGAIEKRGRNGAQGYNYLMAEDVINEVRRAWLDVGLVLIPGCIQQELTTGTTKSGTTQYLTHATFTYTICDVDTGEKIDVQWEGQGQDSGDKGLYKAFTGGLKYWLKNLHMIPSDDDPENDGTPPKAKSNPPSQRQAPLGTGPTTKGSQVPATPPLSPPAPKTPPVAPPAPSPATTDGVEHLNKNKLTSKICEAIYTQAHRLSMSREELHEKARAFSGYDTLTSLFDLGADTKPYAEFLKTLTAQGGT